MQRIGRPALRAWSPPTRRPPSRPGRDDCANRTGGEPAVGAQPAADRDGQSRPDIPWPDAEAVRPSLGFTEFDPLTPGPTADIVEASGPRRAPQGRSDDFYATPIVDGK